MSSDNPMQGRMETVDSRNRSPSMDESMNDIVGLARNRQLTSTERGSLATIKKNSVTDLVQLYHQNTKAK